MINRELTDQELDELELEYADDDSTMGLGDYLSPEFMRGRRAQLKLLFAEVRLRRAAPVIPPPGWRVDSDETIGPGGADDTCHRGPARIIVLKPEVPS